MNESVEVSVWTFTGTEWATVGGATYERLEFEPRHLDVGVWAMTLPQGPQAAAITPGRLVTTTFRDEMWTWAISPRTVNQNDDGRLSVTLGGFDASWMLGWASAWPKPAAAIDAQDEQARYVGSAEAVIRAMTVDNLGSRFGLTFDAPVSLERGEAVRSRPRFDNLLQVVLRVAKRGGLGVRFGLVPTTSNTRAQLTLGFYVPTDKTMRVRMSAAEGSLATWELTENAPTLTKAIVGGSGEGAGQYLRVVTTPESEAQALLWGGHREGFVDGPETFDNDQLDDAGRDAIAEGAASTTLTMEAQEPAGTKAFQSFTVGDRVTAVPYPGVSIPDVVQAIRVVHESAGTPEVTPIFGDPDADDPDAMTAKLIRSLRRDVAQLKVNRKRGAS